MAVFTGTLKLRIVEAADLRPTDFAMRLVGCRKTTIDPYFSVEIQNGTALTLAIFDDRAIPPDEFVADCSLSFEEYALQSQTTGWVWSEWGFNLLKKFRIFLFNLARNWKIYRDQQSINQSL